MFSCKNQCCAVSTCSIYALLKKFNTSVVINELYIHVYIFCKHFIDSTCCSDIHMQMQLIISFKSFNILKHWVKSMFSFCTLAEQFYIINQVFFFSNLFYILKKKVVFLLKRVNFTNLSTFFRALSACVCVWGGIYWNVRYGY